MDNSIKIYCENCDTHIEVPAGTTLLEIFKLLPLKLDYSPLAAYVNNKCLAELSYKPTSPVSLKYIDISHPVGHRVYQRTATFLLQRVMEVLYPVSTLYVRHSLGSNIYCEIEGKQNFSDVECSAIEEAVKEIVSQDIEIIHKLERTEEVVKAFEAAGYDDKAAWVRSSGSVNSRVCYLGDTGTMGYFLEPLAPSSGYLDSFAIVPYAEGFILVLPDRVNPLRLGYVPKADKMAGLFRQFHDWMEIVGVPTVGELNARIEAGDTSELIKIAEAVHGRQFSNVADQIYAAHRDRGAKVVLISGPSSSGKTTSAKRIGIQLRVLGLHPVLISLDDYFVNREDTPKDENGDYDYEALEALDLARLNDDLSRLIAGESVEIPRYDFITGTRQKHDQPLQLDDRSVLIMEGIHGLNPRLTPALEENLKFKIYLSCFTSVALDNINRIHTTDNRLLRRITRDFRTRGNSPQATIARWPSVRRGEEKHIFPYQENADVMINTSLFYEIGVLRKLIAPILAQVPEDAPEYSEANRLLRFVDNFVHVPTDEIPLDSVLREFVGGSSFKY